MLGWKRNTVRLAEHDPDWAALAEEACRRIRLACGPLVSDVQHVGSTAVPGLPAKPILDLAVAVSELNALPKLVPKLTTLGYVYRGLNESSSDHLFVWEPTPGVRTIHLHVVALDDEKWSEYLRFRDVLRRDPTTRDRYAELKGGLKERYQGDRKAYTEGKHEFIRAVIDGG